MSVFIPVTRARDDGWYCTVPDNLELSHNILGAGLAEGRDFGLQKT